MQCTLYSNLKMQIPLSPKVTTWPTATSTVLVQKNVYSPKILGLLHIAKVMVIRTSPFPNVFKLIWD